MSPTFDSTSISGVIKRDTTKVPFDASRIETALIKGFSDPNTNYGPELVGSKKVTDLIKSITSSVVDALARQSGGQYVHIEAIQDQVELALMRAGEHRVAREYVLYREKQKAIRTPEVPTSDHGLPPEIEFEVSKACDGLNDVDDLTILSLISNGVNEDTDLGQAFDQAVLEARTLIDQDPNYSLVASRLFQAKHRYELATDAGLEAIQLYSNNDRLEVFSTLLNALVNAGLLDERLIHSFDLPALSDAIDHGKNDLFGYLAIQTLYDRYFLHIEGVRYETPQTFLMRVAMGLALSEDDPTGRAIEFYELLSSLDYMTSTPTLFNSGTNRPQLSSCYLTTIPDNLDGIYMSMRDNALLSKFAGGLGNDWTPVRGLGARIKGTNGQSQGVVPFLKVANDTAVAVNQGGKRKGAVCAYLESWHIDIEEFLELRKNTGDDRRRTHDMNTANWIPDLFMKRVINEEEWTLFSPNDVPDLHDLIGQDFERAYLEYEEQARQGHIPLHRTVKAVDLWRKMLGMLFETGHPWVTFKDPCNVRYTNQHQGVVHSSNLCTEITLHTNSDEIAVCNLGSVNLVSHIDEHGQMDMDKLKRTVTTALRMLDNVIDYNYYSVEQAKHSNSLHRPVGLGVMGFHDALYKCGVAIDSDKAIELADVWQEAISFYAIEASADLAQLRGSYSTFDGSLWSRGILPIDSLELLSTSRGQDNYLQVDTTQRLDWDRLRAKAQNGMRNSNVMAIAPTATISNICGVSQSIEPTYQNLFVKSNLSGEFTVLNRYLVDALKQRNLWDAVMISDLKYYDGSVQPIDRVPNEIKALFKTAFEIDTRWLIESASRRQKWIDQAISLNLYLKEPSGQKLDNLYKLAWVRGLKTTYYLRSLGATSAADKDADKPNTASAYPSSDAVNLSATAPKACSILDPDCEACQ